MKNNYFDNFPNQPLYMGNTPLPNQTAAPTAPSTHENIPMEQSYIENILRMNKGKKVNIHMTFPDSNEFRDLEFRGIVEQSGRDHIILYDPTNNKWELLLMIYVDFITFEEKINYSPTFIPS